MSKLTSNRGLTRAKHVWAILSLLVKKIKESWPNTKIRFRADSGLCRPKMLSWCESNGIEYVVGISSNNILRTNSADLQEKVKKSYESEKKAQKEYDDFQYAAGSWKKERRIIVKAEHNAMGPNTRYIVTNIDGTPESLYCDIYCQRGDMENRIKEVQTDMFGDRLSSSSYATNQFRLMLSAIAYVYMNIIKFLVSEPNQPKMYCKTLRLKIIKIAVIIRKNTRRIYVQISKNYPYKDLFVKAINRLYALE